jgi:membrane associated rhomboid family serine protease
MLLDHRKAAVDPDRPIRDSRGPFEGARRASEHYRPVRIDPMRSRHPFNPPPSTFAYSFGPGPMTPAIKALILANIVAFVATWVGSSFDILGLLGLRPQAVVAGLEVWRVVTYMFLHEGIFHILFNMLALWMFGVELERMWGSRYFLKYYFVCGLGAAATTLVLSLIPGGGLANAVYYANTVGASGAVYGILLAFALYFPHRPIIMFFVFPVPARYAVMIMGGIALLSAMSTAGGVAHGAHLGGLVAGYLYLRGKRLHLISEIQYRLLKWRINRSKRRFDVYSGGRTDRRVH